MAPDRFGRTLAGALGFTLAVQSVMHIAVTQNALPPTGISLPFVSAGGTALVIMAGAASMLVSVSAHRPVDELADADVD
jgi:cell division protein FtsW